MYLVSSAFQIGAWIVAIKNITLFFVQLFEVCKFFVVLILLFDTHCLASVRINRSNFFLISPFFPHLDSPFAWIVGGKQIWIQDGIDITHGKERGKGRNNEPVHHLTLYAFD